MHVCTHPHFRFYWKLGVTFIEMLKQKDLKSKLCTEQLPGLGTYSLQGSATARSRGHTSNDLMGKKRTGPHSLEIEISNKGFWTLLHLSV